MQFAPKKLYYKIGEVCEIVGVEAYVLRYWETEFTCLSPPKNKAGQRTYRPRDIDLLLQIRKLLYEDGYTIAGARKQLSGSAATGSDSVAHTEATRPSAGKAEKGGGAGPPRKRLDKIRTELENILTLLDRE